MTEAQTHAVIELLSSLTHAVVKSCDVRHSDKVELLDQICAVKRAFGWEDVDLLDEETRQIRAGEEIATLHPNAMCSVLVQSRIMQKWKVNSIIWPKGMGSDILEQS